MASCFIMQPFDGGTFDKRYKDIFAPAICDAGLDPYRVDQDPNVSIPIQEIEKGIRDADICLAEISLDNPNVWFELGFAIVCGKEVVLLCSDERTTKFPFDVQHRTIIKYTTKSLSDFESLRKEITTRVKAYLAKAETLGNVSAITNRTTFEGLDHHEVVCLAALAENLERLDDNASMYQIKRDMEVSGYTKAAAAIAVKSLLQKEYLGYGECLDRDGEHYPGVWFTDKGWNWVLANQDRFAFIKDP